MIQFFPCLAIQVIYTKLSFAVLLSYMSLDICLVEPEGIINLWRKGIVFSGINHVGAITKVNNFKNLYIL